VERTLQESVSRIEAMKRREAQWAEAEEQLEEKARAAEARAEARQAEMHRLREKASHSEQHNAKIENTKLREERGMLWQRTKQLERSVAAYQEQLQQLQMQLNRGSFGGSKSELYMAAAHSGLSSFMEKDAEEGRRRRRIDLDGVDGRGKGRGRGKGKEKAERRRRGGDEYAFFEEARLVRERLLRLSANNRVLILELEEKRALTKIINEKYKALQQQNHDLESKFLFNS